MKLHKLCAMAVFVSAISYSSYSAAETCSARDPDGYSYSFSGECLNGWANGKGEAVRYTDYNKIILKGTFKNGYLNGEGSKIEVESDGTYTDSYTFIDGSPTGIGKRIVKNSNGNYMEFNIDAEKRGSVDGYYKDVDKNDYSFEGKKVGNMLIGKWKVSPKSLFWQDTKIKPHLKLNNGYYIFNGARNETTKYGSYFVLCNINSPDDCQTKFAQAVDKYEEKLAADVKQKSQELDQKDCEKRYVGQTINRGWSRYVVIGVGKDRMTIKDLTYGNLYEENCNF